jgi:hypothetical protein
VHLLRAIDTIMIAALTVAALAAWADLSALAAVAAGVFAATLVASIVILARNLPDRTSGYPETKEQEQ